MEDIMTLWIIVLSILGFFAVWFGIVTLVGRIGGWNKLADKFQDTGMSQPMIDKKRFQSIKLGVSNYSGVVNMAVSAQGLHMSVMFAFKPGHDNILIPWHELKVEESTYTFTFMSLPGVSISVPETLGEWIVNYKKQYAA